MHLLDYVLFRFGPGAASVLAVLLMSAMYAPLIAFALLARFAARSGSYLRWDGPTRKTFSLPPAFAAGWATLVLYIIVLMASLPGKGSLSELLASWWFTLARSTQIFYLLSVGLLIVLLYWGALWWQRRTCTLILNLKEKRYRTFDISSLPMKARTGTWDDIAGIYVRCAASSRPRNASTYFVCLKWCGSSNAYSTLGGFGQPEQAKIYAERVAQELRLPIVVGP